MASRPPKSSAPAEPLNSEQLEAAEAAATLTQTAPVNGPSSEGELEERAADAELRAAAAERRALNLEEELRELQKQVAALMRAQSVPRDLPPPPTEDRPQLQSEADVPVFDPDLPHGLVTGDTQIAYVQNGHQFGHDRRYLATEKHRGSPRAFNPRLIGWVKPRPNQSVMPEQWYRDSPTER